MDLKNVDLVELIQSVEYLFVFQEDLFLQPGLNSEIQQIRDCLDTGSPDMIRILYIEQ